MEERFEVLHEFVEPARTYLSAGVWDYLMGGAETETSLRRNRLSLDSIAFKPRVLRDVRNVDASTEFLGHKLRLPVVLAPIGSLQDIVEDGGLAPTKAAAEFGCMHMLSSVCDPGLEAVAESVDHPKLFQLYVRGDANWVDEYVARAVAGGYAGLAFTVDLDAYGRRERDLSRRFRTTARRTRTTAFDPNQGQFNWDDIKRVRDKFDIPIILKGIATAEDAVIAVEHGVSVIYVSNHGGRQLDHCRGSVADLPEVAKAVNGRAKIMVDGGIMRGVDVVKALALGADAVGMGRMQGLAAAAAGQAGIVRMLEIVEDEVKRCMALLGVTSISELDESFVTQIAPLDRPGLDSAFPLLSEGY